MDVEEEEAKKKRRRETETKVLDKVGDVISIVKSSSKTPDAVIFSLFSLSSLLFPSDPFLLSGILGDRYKDQLLSFKPPSDAERDEFRQAFYHGAGFTTLSRILLIDVASDWLVCFPFLARENVYDVFFTNGVVGEVVQALVPFLQYNGNDGRDGNVIRSNVERLLVLCLVEKKGVLQMAREFGSSYQIEEFTDSELQPTISRMAQIITSIPDKARPTAPTSLSSHSFFQQITIQLLNGVQEREASLSEKCITNDLNGALLFSGETFYRICRRGSSDIIMGQVMPMVLCHVQSTLFSSKECVIAEMFDSNPTSRSWSKLMEAIKYPYAVERMCEQLLHQMAIERVSDVEAYWILWLLFSRITKHQPSIRSMFADKFLLWKVFNSCCLRWILQFAVLQCPPISNSLSKGHDIDVLLDTVQRLAAVWSKREFVQSTALEQQAYVTAAIGLCMELMSREELDKSKDVLHSILQGVSCRLENPSQVVRKMASSVALVFSKAIDPQNPLYLDDSCVGESIDWEFGLAKPEKVNQLASTFVEHIIDERKKLNNLELEKNTAHSRNAGIGKEKESSKLSWLVDPDEVIDPATLNYEPSTDNDEADDGSEDSGSSCDSSLQPYDLTDDATDLKPKPSQLVDVVQALRKTDDADGVERALDVAEKLVRASPDELTHVASDLTRTLVQLRCSDLAVEGEEESAEEKRQRALVALLVTCPFESLDTLNKLLYSPNVDISQRIMILDVMTEAAEELADTKIWKHKNSRSLISTISETQPWFLPSSKGPPGSGYWKEVSETGTLLNYSSRYERELPSKPGQIRKGKTRRWSLRSESIQANQYERIQNKFPLYAAAFMLPAMEAFDKKRQGVDLLGRDFIVLGKLIYMLGVCMRCVTMHPEATVLAPPLLDMLRSREICHHPEAYVRRSVLFAASCVLVSLPPSYVASALIEGNLDISRGLEWVRTWALTVAESDVDRECCTMAISCLQHHSEMALQVSRALESPETAFKAKSIGDLSNLSKGMIKIPHSDIQF